MICSNENRGYPNLLGFNMVTRINESKAETKHISYDYKCKFNGRKCNSNKK